MVFLSAGGKTYKCRVVAPGGTAATCSTGRRVKRDADAVARQVKRWRGLEGRQHARPDVLALIVAKRLALPEAYDAALDGTLDALVARIEAEGRAAEGDLRPHLDGWQAWKSADRTGRRQAARYRREVERLYAGDPLTVDTFVAPELERRIDAATAPKGRALSEGTRSRLKAAALSFGAYLVRQRVLSHNPVRDVRAYSAGAVRGVWYDRATAQAVLARLPQPYAAMSALMVGCGLEWRAVTLLRASDVNTQAWPRTVYARGTKTASRARTCVWLHDNLWAWPYLQAWLLEARPLGDALVFAGFVPSVPPDAAGYAWENIKANKTALKAHRAACAAAGAAPSTLHDWRHSFAVQALRDGYDEAAVAHNLGHNSTQQVRDRYGRFVPQEEDFTPRHRPTDATNTERKAR